METIVPEILTGFRQMTLLEIIAVIMGVVSVLCSRQNSVWVYPTGLVSSGIYVYMLIQPHVKLYADAGLNVYYAVMSVYGWYYWMRKDAAQHETPITRTDKRELRIALAIAGFGWVLLYVLLRHLSNSDVPILDAFVSATACAGMWLLAKRKVENWIFLNISNIVAIPLYFYKHMALTALLTIFLFIVAVTGYFHWLKIYREQQPATR